MNITERAAQYAENKINEAFTKAVAEAYSEGYRAGYEDGRKDIPVDPEESRTEFVDLGLPSGTLWAADYEHDDEGIIYLPYGQAEGMNLPTEEQWKELSTHCRWDYIINGFYDLTKVKCLGPNGNSITFKATGRNTVSGNSDYWEVHFWLANPKSDKLDKDSIRIHNLGKQYQKKNGARGISYSFCGNQLPIRLVK
jgi:hypothetical protein